MITRFRASNVSEFPPLIGYNYRRYLSTCLPPPYWTALFLRHFHAPFSLGVSSLLLNWLFSLISQSPKNLSLFSVYQKNAFQYFENLTDNSNFLIWSLFLGNDEQFFGIAVKPCPGNRMLSAVSSLFPSGIKLSALALAGSAGLSECQDRINMQQKFVSADSAHLVQ